jgi:hypothetical protein
MSMIEYKVFATNEELMAFVDENNISTTAIYSTPVGVTLWYLVEQSYE